MKLSKAGLDLIKEFEGLKLKAYKVVDTEKHYTIGYGHYGADVKKDSSITKAQAEELLKDDVARFVVAVDEAVKVPVNQNQFDALVSFAYNVGIGAFKKSTLLKELNAKDFKGASREFDRWNKSGGKVLQGLVKRRNKEQALFDKPVPSPVIETKKKGTITYRIKMGDTLSEIADEHGASLDEIVAINRITNPNIIYTGQLIRIPKK